MASKRPAWNTLTVLSVGATLAITTGCATTTPQPEASSGSSSSQRVIEDPVPTLPADDEDPVSTTRAEETDTPEDPAGGPTGVSIELAGLPVGGGSAVAVGDAWCQVLFWRGQLPQDVELDVEAVEILDEGAVLQPDGCGDATPCVGTVIAVSGSQMCSVLVTPDSEETPSLRVRLDGTLRCPDAQECESVRAVDNSTFLIENPGGGELDDDSGAGEVVPSGNGDGSDNISDSAGDGGATPASSP